MFIRKTKPMHIGITLYYIVKTDYKTLCESYNQLNIISKLGKKFNIFGYIWTVSCNLQSY